MFNLKKYIFVSDTGNPAYTALPAESDVYVAGQTYGEHTCYEVPAEVPDVELLTTWYWKGSIQKVRAAKPTPNSVWDADAEDWMVAAEEPDEWDDDIPVSDRPVRPSSHHRWDNAADDWVPDITLAKSLIKDQWNAWKDIMHAGGYQGYHTDPVFLSELTMLSLGFSKGLVEGPQLIRKLDNTNVSLSGAEIDALLLEIGDARQAIYRTCWDGKDAVDAASTIAAVLELAPPEL